MGHERRIGCDDDDDGARSVARIVVARRARRQQRTTPWHLWQDIRIARRRARREVLNLFTHRCAGDAQLATRAVIALHQDAHGIATLRFGKPARRRADAAFEAVTHHARAAPDTALRHRTTARSVERGNGMLARHVKPVQVVEPSVERLRHHRQTPRLQPGSRHLPPQDRIAHDPDAVRVGDRDRSLEDPALVQPRRAGHLAVAVQREPRAEHRVRAALSARMHHGHARAHRPLPHDERAAASDQRRVTDLYTGDVGNGIEHAWRAADQRRDAELARAGLWRRLGR